jgi:hypothetical protein
LIFNKNDGKGEFLAPKRQIFLILGLVLKHGAFL